VDTPPAGQHCGVRLTAPDGYTAQRSYSIVSCPLDEREIELRGPFASYFVWRGTEPGPVPLVGGGSGVVPLMAMLSAGELGDDATLTYSRRAPGG